MKKYISQELAEQIKQVNLFDTVNRITELKKQSGASFKGECPMCHSEAFTVHLKKGIYKCFKCDFGGNNPVGFIMRVKNIEYNEALQYLADQFNIILPAEPQTKKPKETAKDTGFKNRQLEVSGLTTKDVKAWEYFPDKQVEIDVFASGTISSNNRVVPGDDMIIYYLDLDGKRIKY
jgi:DNA primase